MAPPRQQLVPGGEEARCDHQALVEAAELVLATGPTLDLDLIDMLAWQHWRRYEQMPSARHDQALSGT